MYSYISTKKKRNQLDILEEEENKATQAQLVH
jgi:hypothetical protein